MAGDDPFDKKLSIIIKEWDHVQFHIGRFDTIIFNIRQWCVTIFTAFLTAAVALHRPSIVLVSVIPTLLFWFLDALHKSFQRHFTDRGREIERYLSSDKFNAALVERSLSEIRGPTMSLNFGRFSARERFKTVLRASLVRNVSMTYCSILTCCLIAYLIIAILS